MRSDSTILLSGWSASRVSRRAKAGTNKNARHSPAHPPLRSWTLARASISSILFPHPSFRIFFPLFPIPYLSVSSARILSSRATPLVPFLVLSRSPSKTNQIFGEVLVHPSQRRRWQRWRRWRRTPGALNVTISPHVENEKCARRRWLETLLYQFQTVATESSFVWGFSFFFFLTACLLLL